MTTRPAVDLPPRPIAQQPSSAIAEPTVALPALSAMVLIFALSLGAFLALARRETRGRARLRLREWAKRHGLRPARPEDGLPAALAPLHAHDARLVHGFADARLTILSLLAQTPARQSVAPEEADQVVAGPDPAAAASGERRVWHALVLQLETPAPGSAGLRPVEAEASLLDLFDLPPAIVPRGRLAPARFTYVGESAPAVRALAEGLVPALLPADVGLLRLERALVLDFSARPFDDVTLARVVALAEQLATQV